MKQLIRHSVFETNSSSCHSINWNTFNQGEYSFYINAVTEEFSPSSRSNQKTSWNNLTINEYFKLINK